jgi:hypothetical protein
MITFNMMIKLNNQYNKQLLLLKILFKNLMNKRLKM